VVAPCVRHGRHLPGAVRRGLITYRGSHHAAAVAGIMGKSAIKTYTADLGRRSPGVWSIWIYCVLGMAGVACRLEALATWGSFFAWVAFILYKYCPFWWRGRRSNGLESLQSSDTP